MILGLLFFGTALLYAAVGFGGGSTYTALLALGGTDYRAIPTLSLICNILVVTAGSWRFHREGLVRWRRIWPLFTLSVPLAWLGGRLELSEFLFTSLLALSLFSAGLAMLFQRSIESDVPQPPGPSWLEPILGGGLGLLSGLIGIGGGIFLAPVLHLIRWAEAKVIAGTCAVFILVNSVAGLAGQLGKQDRFDRFDAVASHWPLLPAVLVGGLAGATLGSIGLRTTHVRNLTALLVLHVAVRLGARALQLASRPA